eukprot:CAMPEP_0113460618 /NCGR_PEP_ID=MMETSP0014_2-20120614/11089_1 /TAXON_ID=2857 /ORGANISM="Nitzschia sp." /LENGTH=399 /DNA_ID=CAMNT_0000352295 /DNA_START=246 /DNA_END=1445 /DNA_ORIENTATION=- /assembly_acc=CAM_ASM_000159
MVNLYGHTRTFVRGGGCVTTANGKKLRGESTAAAAAVAKSAVSVFGGSSSSIDNNKNDNGDDSVPPNPFSLLDDEQLDEQVDQLASWFDSSIGRGGGGGGGILCLTGAGLSTESGIPDYRGHKGSYHHGHKPMLHQAYTSSEYQRKRYWGRSMIGWKKFDGTEPNKGHVGLAELGRQGHVGVQMEDRQEFYDEDEKDEFLFTSGQRSLSIVTQNVDSLHQSAGSKDVVHLHGRGRDLKCMNCGARMDRNVFHDELEATNRDWLCEIVQGLKTVGENDSQRPDGDANLSADFNHVHVPDCPHCRSGFWKPDVVFFGDSVPKHRVELCRQAVEDCNGLLIVGTSLAVHSAFRHVRAASQMGKPIAILNVGETRAEAEGLDGILKVEAPIGETLERLVDVLS